MPYPLNPMYPKFNLNYPVLRIIEVQLIEFLLYGPWHEKTCLHGFANNKGTDQPVYPRSLISAFVICILESIICKLATGEISIF